VYTLEEATIPALPEKVVAQGLSNLCRSRSDHLVKVERLPLQGAGKLDLRGVRGIAMERLQP
jgi:acyl-[acyl-carrier-protein]-phospholipid O-acyltransferase/long-chain-fatty-acid--[acyl-carrier-protein] ligase